MLTQTVEGLVVRTVEEHAPGECVALGFRDSGHVDANLTVGHTEGTEGLAPVLGFVEQRLALGVVEGDATRLLVDTGLYLGSLYADLRAVGDGELGLGRLGHDDKALLLGQLGLAGGLHANDVVVDYLQAYHLGAA